MVNEIADSADVSKGLLFYQEEVMTTDKDQPSWETETGLIHDVDAWILNAKFGMKDEYAQAVAATGAEGGHMLLFDLANDKGEVVGSQGYSIGTGWEVGDDGASIEHPKRTNVVTSTLYGQLQTRVVKDLKVDMEGRGKPTEAKVWNGLGFHWMQQEHPTVGGDVRTSLMPVEFLSAKEAGKTAPTKTAAPPTVGTAEKALAVLARTNDMKTFQEKALSMASVAANDELMASVLEEGPDGFWATHQES